MSKILIAESHMGTAEMLERLFTTQHHRVLKAFSIKSALENLENTSFDLVIFSGDLPDGNAYEVVDYLNESVTQTRTLYLAANTHISHIINSLRYGVDECLAKPFNCDELYLRAKRLLKYHKVPRKEIYKFGKVTFDPERGSLIVGKRKKKIRRKEADILEFILEKRNSIVTRQMLMDNLWGIAELPTKKTIDVYVNRLRKKLGRHLKIETVRGFGYRVKVDEEEKDS